MWACTYEIDRWIPVKLMDRLTAKLVNHLTAMLVNHLTTKPMVVNLVRLHLTKLKHYPVDKYLGNQYCATHWIDIYPVDGIVHL